MADGKEEAEGVTSEGWIAVVRLGGVAFAAAEVGLFTERFPPGHEAAAWILTAAFAVAALAIAALARIGWRPRLLGFGALVVDALVVGAYGLVFSYEWGSPTRWALVFVVVEASLRYGLRGGVALPLLSLPYLYGVEVWRAEEFGPPDFHVDRVSFPFGVLLLTGLIVGWLDTRLGTEARRAAARAKEAERLRDELGRRGDVFEAANRCARALGSSLDLDEAFTAFIRELALLVPFDRTVLMLEEEGMMRVMASAGAGSATFLPRGAEWTAEGSILELIAQTRQVEYREDLADRRFVEEDALLELGLRSRVVAPLQLGGRPIGALSVARREPASFSGDEIELVGLLGQLVANAVQNIRTYDAERATVEELRRLSALRADFVSLVSHELRSPMAAVIGSARTLQQRWRELRPEQREAFLAVIGDETSRLAALISDVLDTSRIDAGTFGYTFADVDMASVLRDAVAAAEVGQDDVRLNADIPPSLPHIRGDRDRLRQLVDNLISNAIKYSDAGATIDVDARVDNGSLRIRVRDRGPGIALEHQRLIFEKFGRAANRDAKPGTGLGLFIARSFAEAHGGTLDVDSRLGDGATFTVALPLGADAGGEQRD